MTGSEAQAKQQRHQRVVMQFSQVLDQLFMEYRAFDGAPLTEGDIMGAVGSLIGGHCKTPERVEAWVKAIALSARASNAAKLMQEKSK